MLGTSPDEPPRSNELGAIYGVRAPNVNASKGAGDWQAYDIWFRAPRFVDGVKTEDARITACLNGVLIHEDVAVPTPTGAANQGGERPRHATGPSLQVGALRLQDHTSHAEGPVRYRNLWIAPLEAPGEDGAHGERRGAWLDLLDPTVTGWVVRGGEATIAIVDEPDESDQSGQLYQSDQADQSDQSHQADQADQADLRPVDGDERRATKALRTVIGTSMPGTPNTFLTTTQRFGDFELMYDARIDPRLNSGVQIRSEIVGGFDERSGALRGLQIELDPSSRAFSGGLYDEQRRGWLHPLHGNPAARRAFRPDDWNTFHVIARGPLIQTWINGIPAAMIVDALDVDGHIALQVHGVGDESEPLQVRFRNIRLRRFGR